MQLFQSNKQFLQSYVTKQQMKNEKQTFMQISNFHKISQLTMINILYILICQKYSSFAILFKSLDNQLNFITKILPMNRSKNSGSQIKIKPKLHIPNSSNTKSVSKTKQKLDRPSPRTNHIHTLEAKKSLQILKKTKLNIEVNQSLREQLPTNRQYLTGYQTPKFKQQTSKVFDQKRGQNLHNFFSFGEREAEKQVGNKKIEKQIDRDKQHAIRREAKQRISNRRLQGFR